jgi:hypothetical protein
MIKQNSGAHKLQPNITYVKIAKMVPYKLFQYYLVHTFILVVNIQTSLLLKCLTRNNSLI